MSTAFYSQFTLITLLAYGGLMASVLSLWLTRVKLVPVVLLAIAFVFAALEQRVSIALSVAVVSLGVALIYVDKPGWRGWLAWSVALALGLALGVHAFSVTNPLVYQGAVKSDSIHYQLFLNFDKTAVGILVVGLSLRTIRHPRDWHLMAYQLARPIVVAILAVSSLALLFGYVNWSPALVWLLPVWLVHNLLFTCLAEEAYFRGLIQRKLAQPLARYRWGKNLAIGIAALLFGVAHIGGGGLYVILATVAGLFYGYVYQKTGRIEAAMLCHVAVNLFHFLFLSYPALSV